MDNADLLSEIALIELNYQYTIPERKIKRNRRQQPFYYQNLVFSR